MCDEAERLLAACRPHLHDVVVAALETGCRKQELLSLQWSQVHWEQNELFLPGTKTKTKTKRPLNGRRVRTASIVAYSSEASSHRHARRHRDLDAERIIA